MIRQSQGDLQHERKSWIIVGLFNNKILQLKTLGDHLKIYVPFSIFQENVYVTLQKNIYIRKKGKIFMHYVKIGDVPCNSSTRRVLEPLKFVDQNTWQ